MKKILALYIAFVMLLGLFMIHPVDEVGAVGTSQYQYQTIKTHMYGENDNERALNLTRPSSNEEQTVDCPPDGNERFQRSQVGTWESEPMRKLTRVRRNSIMNFTIWARGDVNDVMFTIDLTIGGQDAGSYDSERRSLNEDTPLDFPIDDNLPGAPSNRSGNNDNPQHRYFEIHEGETFSITIWFDGQELPGTGGDNHAEIVFGSKDYPAGIRLEMCTIYLEYEDHEIKGDNDEDNPESIILDVNLYRSFDIMDIVALQSSVHGPKDGASIDLIDENEDDMTNIRMIWHYGKDEPWSGTYTFNVSVIDYNNNLWWITTRIDLVIIGKDIDFILKSINIENDKVYKDHPVTINATIGAEGDPNGKGLRPVAYLQILNSSSELVYEDYNTISIDTYDEKTITFFWTVPEVDTYTAKLWIDYLEGSDQGTYKENNDQGTGEENNYGEITFESFKAGKSDDGDDEWYEDTEILAMIGGSSAAVVVAAVAVFLLVRRKQRAEEEEEEEFEDKEDEDEDEEIYEF